MNEKTIRFKSRMSDIEKRTEAIFLYTVSYRLLSKLPFLSKICSRTSITLITGQVIPISRAKAEETQTIFMKYMRSLRP